VGRAPLTTAAYLMAERGMDQHSAVAYLRAARPIIRLNRLQIQCLHAWATRLRAGA
jgi:protein-tyrosine phosphatase